jgi:tyrosinase-like protein
VPRAARRSFADGSHPDAATPTVDLKVTSESLIDEVIDEVIDERSVMGENAWMGLSRRRVLALGAASAVAAVVSTQAGDGGPARIRREITSARAAGDVAIFAAAVAAMRSLPDADPRSLTSLARWHAEHAPHASAAFLPWHRAFLAGFESIARGLTGAPDFALPYWDWTSRPRVPDVFFDRLSYGVRAVAMGATADRSFVGPAVLTALLDVRDAALFQGQPEGYGLLEQGPHNYIHGFIGGTMGTLLSPLDPLFWSHHAFLDRLWTQWSAKPMSTVEEDQGYDGVPVRPATLTFPGAERRHGGARLVFGFREPVGGGGVHVYVNGAFVGSVAFFTHVGHTGMADMPYRLPVTVNGPVAATFRPVSGAEIPPVSARLVPVRESKDAE